VNTQMINNLREKILSELNSLNWIAEVIDWIPVKFWWFPSIYFVFDRIESSVSDSNHHERVYYFRINIFQETTTLWNIQSEKNLCSLLDSVIDCFDRSDLDWLANYIEAVWGNIQAVETDNWPALHGIVLLGIHTFHSLR
jgi:hypothetical protein